MSFHITFLLFISFMMTMGACTDQPSNNLAYSPDSGINEGNLMNRLNMSIPTAFENDTKTVDDVIAIEFEPTNVRISESTSGNDIAMIVTFSFMLVGVPIILIIAGTIWAWWKKKKANRLTQEELRRFDAEVAAAEAAANSQNMRHEETITPVQNTSNQIAPTTSNQITKTVNPEPDDSCGKSKSKKFNYDPEAPVLKKVSFVNGKIIDKSKILALFNLISKYYLLSQSLSINFQIDKDWEHSDKSIDKDKKIEDDEEIKMNYYETHECSIWLEELKKNDNLVRLGNCKHTFHLKWITSWLNSKQNGCPNCRNEVLKDV